jgi:cellulose synthase/poly-beta-1,6-N-acetylglucosamine synthase-like glycosyltransferase
MSLVCCIFAGVFGVLSIYPYSFYPLSLMLLPKRPLRRPAPGWRRPSVAICMAAFNEEKVIADKITNLLAMARAYGPASIHVYVDGAQDRTPALLEPFGSQIEVVVSEHRRGKTVGMKALVAGVQTDLLAFTDANVRVPEDCLTQLVEALQDPDVCCASARLIYTNRTETGASASGAIYWNIEEFIKSLETETASLIGVDGAMFVIDRAAYNPPPDELIDDFYVSMSALLSGRRVISAQSVLVAERGAVRWQEEFRRKARISCQSMNVHRALWPRLRRASPLVLYGYLAHRFLKWMTPFNLLFTGLFAFAAVSFRFGAAIPSLIAAGLIAALLLGAFVNAPLCRMIAASITSLAGVAWGVLESVVAKRTYTVWEPALTVRD